MGATGSSAASAMTDACLPEIVLIHGWACPASYWNPLLADLARRGLRARAVTLPGYDGDWSGAAEAWTTAGAAEAVARLHQNSPSAARRERVLVVGHSLGGTVAAQLTATRPELVAGLVLVGMVPVPPADATRRRLTGLFGSLGLVPPMPPARAAIEACIAGWYGEASLDPTFRADVEAAFALPPAVLYGSLIAALDGVAPEVECQITAPTAVVLGARDLTREPREITTFMERHPAWRLESVERAGHMVHWERPEVCGDVIARLTRDASSEASPRPEAPTRE
ncbi:alpha/beta hydrolase [Sinomonas sp. JGH33]|uniref:Alpha/beta hydrolase n=1 Tax=Sinomonas terricola TaxID=3110330 RepID=A0ABU5T7J4_9MICC|nr:alpha/beta hydrolase [Sinomonas sp. JGH33]MEA5455658.1 alpha/beta hydrolase [Sinomonas sp. JGH33]